MRHKIKIKFWVIRDITNNVIVGVHDVDEFGKSDDVRFYYRAHPNPIEVIATDKEPQEK